MITFDYWGEGGSSPHDYVIFEQLLSNFLLVNFNVKIRHFWFTNLVDSYPNHFFRSWGNSKKISNIILPPLK